MAQKKASPTVRPRRESFPKLGSRKPVWRGSSARDIEKYGEKRMGTPAIRKVEW